MNRRGFLALAGATAVAALTACGDGWESNDADDDCDSGDLRERDPDCGYYDRDGKWVLYPWVKPNVGGKPPAGRKPRPPKGVKGAPPKGTSGGGSRGGGSRSGPGGGGSRGGGGGRR